jgi:hypothetical protein
VEPANLDKKLKPKNFVTVACDFIYLEELIKIDFTSSLITFRPKSLNVFFKKQSVTAIKFPEVKQFFAKNAIFQGNVSFSKIPIDFFGFSIDRIFLFEFEYESKEFPSKCIRECFKLTLPVVKQAELRFKPPGTKYPDVATRRICTQGFQMTENNSNEEIQRCIILEEFKLMAIVDRYAIYGYTEMLHFFLDIENSFELDLVQKLSLNNSLVHKMSTINYKIDVSMR